MTRLVRIIIGTLVLCLIDNVNSVCEDEWRSCYIFKHTKSFCCSYNQNVIKNCQKFCGICKVKGTTTPTRKPVCYDRYSICASKTKYHCRKYPYYYNQRCPKLCGLCKVPTTTPTTRPAGCVDNKSFDCPSYEQVKSLFCRLEEIRRKCPILCNACHEVWTTSPTTTKSRTYTTTTTTQITTTTTQTTTTPQIRTTIATTTPTNKVTTEASTRKQTVHTTPQIPSKCGISSARQKRVINGNKSTPGQWPWHASLIKRNKLRCGGALITPEWILTSSLCVNTYAASSLQVRLGETNDNISSVQTLQVKYITIHPEYNKPTNLNNDIALLKLSRPALLDDYVQTICLPNQEATIGSKCYMSGRGKISHPGHSTLEIRHAGLTIINNTQCIKLNSKYVPITDTMLCASSKTSRQQSTCHGDNGGPFVCQQIDGRWILDGITSWGSPRCDPTDAYSVFVRVSKYRQWIDKQLKLYKNM